MDTDLQPALRLDITIENGKRTLIEKDFSLAEIRASNGIAQLDFEVLPDDVKNLELRALSLGVADFLIGMKRYVVNESDQIVYFDADFFDIESQEATQPVLVQFIAENLQSLSGLRQ